MNNSKDLDISFRLAQAIGYLDSDIRIEDDNIAEKVLTGRSIPKVQVLRHSTFGNHPKLIPMWRTFDYKDWNVIGPIAAKYLCFPTRSLNCDIQLWGWGMPNNVWGETPQEAIAISVINRIDANWVPPKKEPVRDIDILVTAVAYDGFISSKDNRFSFPHEQRFYQFAHALLRNHGNR